MLRKTHGAHDTEKTNTKPRIQRQLNPRVYKTKYRQYWFSLSYAFKTNNLTDVSGKSFRRENPQALDEYINTRVSMRRETVDLYVALCCV